MGADRSSVEERLSDQILLRLGRRQSTAAVLFNHAVAERVGLGPTDHKCLDLLIERGPMTGSDLTAITGLTSGAITGVAARLERAGFVHRTADPQDRRKQVFSPVPDRIGEIDEAFSEFRGDMGRLLDGFDAHQLAAIAEFLEHSADRLLRHAVLLRAHAVAGAAQAGSAGPPSGPVVAAGQSGGRG